MGKRRGGAHGALVLASCAAVMLGILAGGAAPARAVATLGANYGISALTTEGSSAVIIGIPHSGELFFGRLRPGFRVGALLGDGASEIYLDTGLSLIASEGQTLHSFIATVNYQHNVNPRAQTVPYVTAGLGFAHIGFEGESTTLSVFGVGAGVRNWLPHRGGGLRTEVRYDRINNGDAGVGTDVLGFKLGFDLLLGAR